MLQFFDWMPRGVPKYGYRHISSEPFNSIFRAAVFRRKHFEQKNEKATQSSCRFIAHESESLN